MGLRRSFKPTNLVTNGNFANGTTGWKANKIGTPVISENICSFTATANAGMLNQIISTSMVVGHKLYAFAKFAANSNLVRLYINDSGASSANTPHAGDGVMRKYSVLHTITQGTSVRVRILDDRASGWDEVQVMEFLAINLTACLPANILALSDANLKAWCDLNIPNWFDGTLSTGVIGGTGGLK